MLVKQCCEESINPRNLVDLVRYRFAFKRDHPDYFDADGLLIFVGPQGSGKTLSAVNYVYRLMQAYPACKLVTNLALSDYPIVTFDQWCAARQLVLKALTKEGRAAAWSAYVQDNRVFEFVDNDDFTKYFNGEYGMIFLVDEIQLYLNSLMSKNINMEVVTQISQQRKQRKHIVATSQVFGRMAKPLREQFSSVVYCKSYFGQSLQCNALIDRDSMEGEDSTDTNLTGQVVRKFWYWRRPEMFERYDTYHVIEKGKFVHGEAQREGIYVAPAIVRVDEGGKR